MHSCPINSDDINRCVKVNLGQRLCYCTCVLDKRIDMYMKEVHEIVLESHEKSSS
jgi:hypothetical protein